jgi:hypothetical protein
MMGIGVLIVISSPFMIKVFYHESPKEKGAAIIHGKRVDYFSPRKEGEHVQEKNYHDRMRLLYFGAIGVLFCLGSLGL